MAQRRREEKKDQNPEAKETACCEGAGDRQVGKGCNATRIVVR